MKQVNRKLGENLKRNELKNIQGAAIIGQVNANGCGPSCTTQTKCSCVSSGSGSFNCVCS
ncbi:MAG: hypothetical protein QM528_07500 [Phycisphaerales bacterium]|nr:hypothetical protein [Phycisphaerales bacterium]MDI9358775.1 hypothetical protein [Phycisphaerales bacterium]